MKTVGIFIALAFCCVVSAKTQNVGVGTNSPKAAFNVAANKTVLFGNDTTSFGSKLIWFPLKNALRSGTYFTGHTIGNFSTALGASTADGENASAMGNSGATGISSTAMGNSVAAGNASSAFGFSYADSLGATAMGYSTATGQFSTAMGKSTATGTGATSAGNLSKASGDGAIAMGNNSIATGDASISIGYSSTATGTFSVSLGNGASSSNGGIALGNNRALGIGSIAAGYQSLANGPQAIAIGNNVIAYDPSVAIGNNTLSIGYASVAIGDRAVAYLGSTAIGREVEANGLLSTAMGVNATTAAHTLSFVINGSSNASSSNVTGNTANNQMMMNFNEYVFWTNTFGKQVKFWPDGGISTTGPICAQGSISSNLNNCFSDVRLKKNISPVSASLKKLLLVNPVNYFWKDSTISNRLQTGVIAQEIEKIFPELVTHGKDDILSVNYIGLIPHLVAAMQDQQNDLVTIKKTNETLAGYNATLQTKLNDVTARLEKLQQQFESFAAKQADNNATEVTAKK